MKQTSLNNIETDPCNNFVFLKYNFKFNFSRFKANNCMREITTLMKTCESEIERRNEQIKILLEAYEKYQSHNKTLCNILQEMKSARDELSKYRNVDNDTN